MKMRIYGAGMAGLIAGNMLRRFSPEIHEAGNSLSNHQALLRFRSEDVSNATGIPFKEVSVHKSVLGSDGKLSGQASVADMNAYSQKVTGSLLNRSIANLDPCQRWIAPVDFLAQLSSSLDIKFKSPLMGMGGKSDFPIISTIPMPMMMKIVGWKDTPKFNFESIEVTTVDLSALNCNIYQTIYLPHGSSFYRASITGSKLIIESTCQKGDPSVVSEILDVFGISHTMDILNSMEIKSTTQRLGKIVPIDENVRKEFMLYLTQKFNIYSLGRFATWRQILLDDVVQDIKVIEKMISKGDYSAALQSAGIKQ